MLWESWHSCYFWVIPFCMSRERSWATNMDTTFVVSTPWEVNWTVLRHIHFSLHMYLFSSWSRVAWVHWRYSPHHLGLFYVLLPLLNLSSSTQAGHNYHQEEEDSQGYSNGYISDDGAVVVQCKGCKPEAANQHLWGIKQVKIKFCSKSDNRPIPEDTEWNPGLHTRNKLGDMKTRKLFLPTMKVFLVCRKGSIF